MISVFSGRYHIMSNASIVNNCIISLVLYPLDISTPGVAVAQWLENIVLHLFSAHTPHSSNLLKETWY